MLLELDLCHAARPAKCGHLCVKIADILTKILDHNISELAIEILQSEMMKKNLI